jgi:hypothetical protein
MVKRWNAAALAVLLLGGVAVSGDEEKDKAAEEAEDEAAEATGDAMKKAGKEFREAAD